jgi:hypothetical protein
VSDALGPPTAPPPTAPASVAEDVGPPPRRTDRSIADQVTDLRALVIAYFKQETVDPIRSLGRFVLWGVLGAVLLGIGVTFLAVGVLRLLQTETGGHLGGNWSWVPYAVVVAALLVGGLVSWKLGRRKGR